MTTTHYYAQDVGANTERPETRWPNIKELASWIQQGVIVLDSDMLVTLANSQLGLMAGRDAANMVGRNLYDVFPEFDGSVTKTYIEQAIRTGEPCNTELPDILRKGNWYRLQVLPLPQHTTILIRDITPEVSIFRLADIKHSVVDALDVHPHVGYARINLRGRVERVSHAMCTRLALKEERVMNVPLSDLIPVRHRARFREEVERVLTGSGPVVLETELLANDGSTIRAHASVAELRGVYGSEGAVAIFSFH